VTRAGEVAVQPVRGSCWRRRFEGSSPPGAPPSATPPVGQARGPPRGRAVARASSSATHRWPSGLEILRVAAQPAELVLRGAADLTGG
jgi:hypothetical protein